AGQGLSALAWRRGGAQGGVRQPGAVEIRDRAGDHAPARRDGRAVLRPHPRSRRHATGLAARTRKRPQALPDSCRRLQSRRADARPPWPGAPREAADARAAFIFVLQTDSLLVFGLIALIDAEPAALVVTISLAPTAN